MLSATDIVRHQFTGIWTGLEDQVRNPINASSLGPHYKRIDINEDLKNKIILLLHCYYTG
jgi:hypothetical protein